MLNLSLSDLLYSDYPPNNKQSTPKDYDMLVNNILDSESNLINEYSDSKNKLKNTFCSEVNCTNKYTRQVLVKSKSQINSSNQADDVFQIPLCQHHYENFHNPIELENDIEVVPIGFDQH